MNMSKCIRVDMVSTKDIDDSSEKGYATLCYK